MKSVNKIYVFIISVLHFSKNTGGVFGDILKHSKECALLLENFASASSDFMFCTLQNARPVHICCSCIKAYNEVLKKHDMIVQIKQNSSICNEKLINQDKLEVIESTYSYITGLWSRGQCKNCFESKNTSIEPSNTTKEYDKLYSDTAVCLMNHYNSTSKTYSPCVCYNCSTQYYKMNQFYAEVKETVGNGNICIDIVDTMNVTQHLWSNILHCGETPMTVEWPLIAFSSFFLFLPILFYLGSWKFTKARSSDVLHHNRLSQMFKEMLRTRTASSIST